MSGPLSLSGAEIEGQLLVRYIYADESGISANEQILVVAGVIIHSDSQWDPVERQILSLVDKYVSEEHRHGFIFHATELYHGSGKIFGHRDQYPLDKSHEVLKGLLSIPSMFWLPVVFGFTKKLRTSQDQTAKARRDMLAFDHAMAFSLCAIGAEKSMRKHSPNEVATIIAEDNTDTKATVKKMHDAFRGVHPTFNEWVKQRSLNLGLGNDFFPIRRIKDTVHFVGKSGAPLMQIADAAAFIIRCYLEQKPEIDQFVRAFIPRGGQGIIDLERLKTLYAGLNEVRCWGDA
ncbi:MAG TPA: DUF3800 domain-containing protein [Nitrososphaera sp.]|nr:DUF3800 domain-containing protein [Nitrososphaera sp.]